MLVLTRKQGEEIRIGDDIVLKVTAVQGGRVRIGIDAPRSHRIVRPETEVVAEPQMEAPTGRTLELAHA